MLSVVIPPLVVLISETDKPRRSEQNMINTPTAIKSNVELLPSPDPCFLDQGERNGENSIRFFAHRLHHEIQADIGNIYCDGLLVSISTGSYKICSRQHKPNMRKKKKNT